MKKIFFTAFLVLISVSFSNFFFSCNSNYTVGKKKGYFKIDFPEKKYRLFDQPGYPYSFEYPVYASVIKDTSFFDDRPENPWWINVDIPEFSGRIYLSYKVITSRNKLDTLVGDAYKMVYKQHALISTGITDSLMKTANGVEGIYFSLAGNTATANQFFLTDSTKNFLRGALYFNTTPNADSLGVVNDFLKQDIRHLINTFKWK